MEHTIKWPHNYTIVESSRCLPAKGNLLERGRLDPTRSHWEQHHINRPPSEFLKGQLTQKERRKGKQPQVMTRMARGLANIHKPNFVYSDGTCTQSTVSLSANNSKHIIQIVQRSSFLQVLNLTSEILILFTVYITQCILVRYGGRIIIQERFILQ